MPDFAVSTIFKSKDVGLLAFFKKAGKQAGFFGDDADEAFRKASRSGSRLGDIVKGILVTDVIKGGLRQLQRGLTAVSSEFIDYDAAITAASAKFKGLDLATREGIETLDALKSTAREVGATTEFSATQAAGGLEFLAMAGFGAEQSIAALPGVVDLATASNVDLARATDIASDSLGAFGLMAEDTAQLTTNLSRVNDVFAKTTTTANTNMEQLFEAVQKGAPAFTAAGQSMETFAALTGVMANSGVKGAEAGTSLRNVMLRLANPVKEASSIMNRLGVQTKDQQGNFRDIIDILGDFEKGLEGMGTAQRTQALATVFGARAVTGINLLLQEGTDGLRQYRGELENSAGASKTMADVIRGSIGNQLAGLRSALIELGFQFFDTFKDQIGPAIKSLTEFIREIDIPAIRASFNSFLDVLNKFSPIIWGITAAFVAYKGIFIAFALASKIKTFLLFASALKAVGIAQGILNVVMLANPIGLVAAAIGLLVAGVALLIKNWDAVVEAFKSGSGFFGGLIIPNPFGLVIKGTSLLLKNWEAIIESFTSGFGIFDKIAGFFGDGDQEVEVTRARNPRARQAPNAAQVAAQQVQFQGQLNIAGAPEGSTVSGETTGAPPVRLELAGVNP